MTDDGAPEAPRPAMSWTPDGDRAYLLELSSGEWIEVRRPGADSAQAWHVEGRLCGTHYKLAEAFATKEIAQGAAVLLAMRLLPGVRDALHAVIDGIPGVWWWKLSPPDATADDHRTITSSRASDSAAAAERSGRAAGRGWWLYVYGPGVAHAFGRLPG